MPPRSTCMSSKKLGNIKMKRLSRLLLALAVAGIAAPGSAHHSFAAEFDAAKPVSVEGVITKIRIVNPHSWVYLDVKDKDGATTNWGFEFGTPILLKTKGIAKTDVEPGTRIAIDGYRSRNGGAYGYSRLVKLADGRSIQIGSAADAPDPTKKR
jgi:hypothetical protein